MAEQNPIQNIKPAISLDEQIKNERHRALSDQIASIHASLVAIHEEDIATLPEDVFKATFLPFFAGQPTDANINASVWAGIAGNPYRPVNIIGVDGEVLYTIPSLFDRQAVDPTKASDHAVPMQHVMITHEQLTRISPIRAQSYMNSQLAQRKIAVDVTPTIAKNIQTWNQIFKRYNLPTIEVKDGASVTTVSKEGSDAPALDYDEDIL